MSADAVNLLLDAAVMRDAPVQERPVALRAVFHPAIMPTPALLVS